MTDLINTETAYTHNSPSVHFSNTEQQLRRIEAIEDNYSYHVRHFCAWIRTTGQGITFDAILDYFAELNRSGLAANTIRIKRQAVLKRVRMLFKDHPLSERVQLEEAIKDLNIGETRAPKVNSAGIGADKIITPLEYERLLQGARSERQRLFMMFLWVTGCRISEVLGVKLAHCETQGDRVHIRILGKGKKERFIWLPTVVYERIQKCFKGSTWLFETGAGKPYSRSYVSNQIAKLGRAILDRRISAHTFRHSFATRKIKETGKIQAVSEYLGHSSVAITLNLYCHDSLTADDLASETDMIGVAA